MQFFIKHSLPGRIRVGYDKTEITPRQAALAKELLSVQDNVLQVTVNPITAAFLILYDPQKLTEKEILALFKAMSSKYLDDEEMLASVEVPKKQPSLLNILVQMAVTHYAKKFLPPQICLISELWTWRPESGKASRL